MINVPQLRVVKWLIMKLYATQAQFKETNANGSINNATHLVVEDTKQPKIAKIQYS